MKRHELHYLSSDKKTNIHALIWEPDGTPKGIIQLSHGITEYMERYEVIAQRITAAGWIFCGNDNLGHGESLIDEEHSMCCEDWNILIQDFTFFQKMIQEYYPAMPYFILGFSLGSFVVRKFALEHKDRINGMILIGTGYANPKLLDIVRVIMQREIKKHGAASKGPLVRSFAFGQYNVKFRPNHTEFDWLCSDLDVLDTYFK